MRRRSPLVAILAAGGSVRFAGDKLDHSLAARRVGAWVIEAVRCAGLEPGVIVCREPTPAFAGEATGWDILINRNAENGLSTSLATAIGNARERSVASLLILLADMPCIDPAFLRGLAESPAPTATAYGDGRVGVPATLDRSMFTAAASLSGDRGAGALFADRLGCTALAAPAGTLIDIDRREDVAAAETLIASRIITTGRWTGH